MIIFLDSPRFFNRILLSAKVALPAVQDSEQVEKLAKDLLIEMYTDYELLARHKKELKAALIEFDRKRDKLIAQNKEAEANTLLSGMIQEIIGKRCCFDDLEEVAEKIAFELD